MKMKELAEAAKAAGYTHIAAIVKTHFTTSYYNVQSIEDVISAGRWIGLPGASRYKLGTAGNKIDWSKTIEKSMLMHLAAKELVSSENFQKLLRTHKTTCKF